MLHPFDPYYLFERSAERWPGNTALRIGAKAWTYSQLRDLARGYSVICETHSKKYDRVAVFGRKSVEAYAAILGILRSGRSYVPLHPDHPPARWNTMLEKSEVKMGLIATPDLDRVDRTTIDWFSDPGDISNLADVAYINDKAEAYLMFTSGSTGGPKGVPVGRMQVASYLEHQLNTYSFEPQDRFTQFFALTFDLSVHDLFVCWGAGACLCVPEDDAALRTTAFVRDMGITTWFCVPSQVRILQRMRALSPGSLPGVKRTFFCGEALTNEIVSAWMQAAPQSLVVNLYGPTEATIAVTAYSVEQADLNGATVIPIGLPFQGHAVLVDAGSDLLPYGEGELLINGPQVNNGYLKDEAATARAFIPMDDGTWYRTGDLVRVDPDGKIHFLGRTDDQLKIMGHRVEPAEVDIVLAKVLLSGTSITIGINVGGNFKLITFIDKRFDEWILFQHLREHLPTYMIPDRIIHIDRFLYSAHGKLDKRALEELARAE